MSRWVHHVKIKHIFTEDEDHETVQANMNKIADILKNDDFFFTFHTLSKFRKIPKGDEFFSPCDYANKLLDKMYDFADEHRIWIE